MNKILKLSVITIAVSLIFLSGCRSMRIVPVVNIQNSTIEVNGNYSKSDVKKAIITAVKGQGWGIKTKKGNHIVAVLFVRQITATIDIRFNKKNYSITYKDSSKLSYDGTNIHRNYNTWIQNLDNRIQAELSNI